MQWIKKTGFWMKGHKKTTGAIIVLAAVIGFLGYRQFAGDATTAQYVLGTVTRGTISESITGTGEVVAANEVTLTAKASGDLVYVNAKAGQTVQAGDVIAQIDGRDAAYDLETARLKYDDLITVDPDDVRDREHDLREAESDLDKDYISGLGVITTAITNMSNMLDTADDLRPYLNRYASILSNRTDGTQDYRNRADESFYVAQDALEQFVKVYGKTASMTATINADHIDVQMTQAEEVATAFAQMAKYYQDTVIAIRNNEYEIKPETTEAYTTVIALVSSANSNVSNVLNAKNSISTSEQAVVTAKRTLSELIDGPTDLEIRAEALSLRQKQDAYNDYFVRAPFDGVIAAVSAKVGQNVNSGTSIATVITTQKLAEISLNEVDVAKVSVGQTVTSTFDALPELSIKGTVSEVDLVGTQSQGVVNYTVKIAFDTTDSRVKTGMTVSADIVTQVKDTVLKVPAGAITSVGGKSYVQLPAVDGSATSTTRVVVVTGMTNNKETEIISGLEEGQKIVTRTIAGGTTKTAASAATTNSRTGFGSVR